MNAAQIIILILAGLFLILFAYFYLTTPPEERERLRRTAELKRQYSSGKRAPKRKQNNEIDKVVRSAWSVCEHLSRNAKKRSRKMTHGSPYTTGRKRRK
jgi:hypothetical protein|nr:MAG TPA: hypothetical protein [Caudoviricetes sp.]